MSEKEPKDYRSEDDQIFFHYGKGYGLTENLQSICLGKEEDILDMLNTGVLKGNPTPAQREALAWVIECRKEQGIGTTDTRAADMERAGNNGASGHKPKAVRLFTPRKKLPLRPSRTKGKSLARK